MDRMFGALTRPRALFILSCGVITAISFWTTLMLLDPSWIRSSSPAVVTALPAGTPTSNVADLPAIPDLRFSWFGIAGINAQIIGGVPVVSGQPILRLVALQDGPHTVAARVTELDRNQKYRITAWIKPQAGANFAITARDQPDKDNGPNNGGAIFDLAARKVLSAYGNAEPGIDQVGDWVKVWIDLLTTDGQYVVNFSVCNGAATAFAGDGRLGVILGGIAVD
jgi:hypothetical protein